MVTGALAAVSIGRPVDAGWMELLMNSGGAETVYGPAGRGIALCVCVVIDDCERDEYTGYIAAPALRRRRWGDRIDYDGEIARARIEGRTRKPRRFRRSKL